MDDFSGDFCKNGTFPVVRVLSECLKAKRINGSTILPTKKTTPSKKPINKPSTKQTTPTTSIVPNITSIFDLYDEPSIFDFYDDAFFDLYDDNNRFMDENFDMKPKSNSSIRQIKFQFILVLNFLFIVKRLIRY